MKKIFLFIILIISLRGLGQYPITQNLGSNTTKVQVPANGAMNALFINRPFVDTIAANLTNIKFYAGAMIFTTGVGLPNDVFTNVIWIRDLTATRWINGGGASSTNINNIYDNSIVNIIVYNDSCLVLHTGGGGGDTICTQFDCGITGWTVTSDSTIQICGFVCPDTINIVCNTFTFPSTPMFLFLDWQTQNPIGVIKSGGTLTGSRIFNTANYDATFGGYPYGSPPIKFYQFQTPITSPLITAWYNTDLTHSSHGVMQGRGYTDSAHTQYGIHFTGAFGNNFSGFFDPVNMSGYGTLNVTDTLIAYNVNNINSKVAGTLTHTFDTYNNHAFSIWGKPATSIIGENYITSDSLATSFIAHFENNGRVIFPQYIHIADAATDSAFYKGANGQINYGKVNTTAVNIYNSDGTLTGNRKLTLGAGQSLYFMGTGTIPVVTIRDPADGTLYFGRPTTNGTFISLDSTGGLMQGQAKNGDYWELDGASDLFHVVLQNGFNFLNLDAGNSTYQIGDISSGGSGNNNYISIDDANQITKVFTDSFVVQDDVATRIKSLAGTGSRTVLADANGVLSAPVSDRSVKERIRELNGGLRTIMKLKPVSFEYREGWKNYGEGIQMGFIAQDIQRVLPNSTFINPNGKMGYNETDIIPILVKAVQEQQAQINELKKEILKLKIK